MERCSSWRHSGGAAGPQPFSLRLLMRGMPWMAVASAGMANAVAMRYKEAVDGITVYDGDGRAALLGELVPPAGNGGVAQEIQLKGSGPTRFSRGGDGRAALGPVIREYIVSEAMAALGVPTTRALAPT